MCFSIFIINYIFWYVNKFIILRNIICNIPVIFYIFIFRKENRLLLRLKKAASTVVWIEDQCDSFYVDYNDKNL